jgi:hypothetical protein
MVSAPRAFALGALCALAACGDGGGGGNHASNTLSIAEAVARNAGGVAVHLDETVQTEGVATVTAGVFSNNKLKIFLQESVDGIMLYHQSAADIEAFAAGDRIRATGVIRQQDPTSDNNLATGTVLVDVTAGSWELLSSGNALPPSQPVTLATLEADGDAYTGTVVTVDGARLASGEWPVLGDRSKQVSVTDDSGGVIPLRFQRNTITAAMADKLAIISNHPFRLTGIVVQDDIDDDGQLLSGYEIWVRGADDVQSAS